MTRQPKTNPESEDIQRYQELVREIFDDEGLPARVSREVLQVRNAREFTRRNRKSILDAHYFPFPVIMQDSNPGRFSPGLIVSDKALFGFRMREELKLLIPRLVQRAEYVPIYFLDNNFTNYALLRADLPMGLGLRQDRETFLRHGIQFTRRLRDKSFRRELFDALESLAYSAKTTAHYLNQNMWAGYNATEVEE